jgi:hypothetical protein
MESYDEFEEEASNSFAFDDKLQPDDGRAGPSASPNPGMQEHLRVMYSRKMQRDKDTRDTPAVLVWMPGQGRRVLGWRKPL